MSFLRSLFSGVSGLRSHQLMMDVLGNNIANVNTVGFKGGRITFGDLFSQTLRGATQPVDGLNGGVNPQQVGLGAGVNTLDTIFNQGSIENTNVSTDLAIAGTGFFIVNLGGQNFYSRVGTFEFDANGTLSHPGTGARLQGKMADALGVVPPGTTLEDIRIAQDTRSPARATGNVRFSGNLSSSLTPPDGDWDTTVDVIDSLGTKHEIQVSFTKDTNGTNTWNWTATVAGTNDPATLIGGNAGTLVFNSDGTLQSSTGGDPLELDPNNGATSPQQITLDFGVPSPTTPGVYRGITQSAGNSSVTVREQDGYVAGVLTGIEIDTTGKVIGAFSNGDKRTLAQIMMAEFNNPGGLVRKGDNLFDSSGNSGIAAIIQPGAGSNSIIKSGALEQSNVDLSEEFTRMILAQRGFQANARVITTSDEFLTEVVNLKR